ncbi:DUF5304 family protein [Streptomyces otsuchiensis]|uniref:DUF5304 family protein n=1 Tax=Streptomyces otsuchiensis TaxID=2681388 RepID=UPI0010308C88|nr:DUF5304 family protein [Streptomyces otsuchiensis]
MSDAHQSPSDDDAWATACEEDLAAERERRRAAGQGSEPADELRHFFDTLADRIGQFASGPAGWVAGDAAARARAAVDPVLDRHKDTIGHLAKAGDELAAALRAAFTPQQSREGEKNGESTPDRPAETGDTGDDGEDGRSER